MPVARGFSEEQISASFTSSARKPAQNILPSALPNGLLSRSWNRNFIDHKQIDVPEKR